MYYLTPLTIGLPASFPPQQNKQVMLSHPRNISTGGYLGVPPLDVADSAWPSLGLSLQPNGVTKL